MAVAIRDAWKFNAFKQGHFKFVNGSGTWEYSATGKYPAVSAAARSNYRQHHGTDEGHITVREIKGHS